MLTIGSYGIYKAIVVVVERNYFRNHGHSTEATIIAISKDKCGFGYGYSAKYSYSVNGRSLTGFCSCESRSWVREGDKYRVVYDSITPEKSQLVVDP